MVFVTGGTGLVGSHLLLELLLKGKSVRALKRPHSDLSYCMNLFDHFNELKLFDKIEWVDGDILDIYSLDEALVGVKDVYHSAAMISFRKKEYKKMTRINVQGTANMIDASLKAGVERFSYVSSIAALGRPNKGVSMIDESQQWNDSKLNTGYAISKFSAEREVWRGMAEGLCVSIVNPSIILGVSDPTKGSTRIFRQVWDGLSFYPTGINGFVDVKDVVKAMVLLLENGICGERYILNGDNLSYKALFSRIAELYGKRKPSIAAGSLVMGAAWRFEAIRSAISGTKPLITKETARTSSNRFRYSNEKIRIDQSFHFRDMDETLKEYAGYYEKEFLKN